MYKIGFSSPGCCWVDHISGAFVLLCSQLMNAYFPDAMDLRALSRPSPEPLSPAQLQENAQLCLASCSSIGLQLRSSCTAAAIVQGISTAIADLYLAVILAGELKRSKPATRDILRQWQHYRPQQQLAAADRVEHDYATLLHVLLLGVGSMMESMQHSQQVLSEAPSDSPVLTAEARQHGQQQLQGWTSSLCSSDALESVFQGMLWLLPEHLKPDMSLLNSPQALAEAVMSALHQLGLALPHITADDLVSCNQPVITIVLLWLLDGTAPQWAAAANKALASSSSPGLDHAASSSYVHVPGHVLDDQASLPSSGAISPRGSWPADGILGGQLWANDDAEDDASITREERTLRMWLNSLGCATHCHSLFGQEIRSGWLLLEALDVLRPGSVDWRLASKPPFKRVVAQIKSLENCGLAMKVASETFGLPLVSIR